MSWKCLVTRFRLLGIVWAAALAAVLFLGREVQGQFLMMPDSTNNRIVLFDPLDGSVVNSNYFALQGGTQVHAMQVGNEIWVSEQVGDRVSRWDLTGNFLGNIGGQFAGGGLDNIRGMGFINNTVYVTNAGTANNAPGNSVVMFDIAGNNLGFFGTTGLAPSPFGILAFQGDMLVSSSSANDDIHRFTLAGASVGTFHNSTLLNFVEQMVFAANGDVLAAGFSSNNIARLDTSGNFLSSFTASGARGVWQLGNGNIMWTNSSGAHIFDVNTNSSSLVYSGGGRYIDFLNLNVIPEPAGGLILACFVAGACLRRRRNQRA